MEQVIYVQIALAHICMKTTSGLAPADVCSSGDIFKRHRIRVIFINIVQHLLKANLIIDLYTGRFGSRKLMKIIKDKFKYQHEIKMVAELLSTKEIEIEEPKRLEIRLNSQSTISTTII